MVAVFVFKAQCFEDFFAQTATLDALRSHHPAWQLLRSDHAPLVASFLHRVFVVSHVRAMAVADLAEALEDALYALRLQQGRRCGQPGAHAALLRAGALQIRTQRGHRCGQAGESARAQQAHGQPARFILGAERARSISAVFAHFGSVMTALRELLRKRLRGLGAELHDFCPPYAAWFRRRFGIDDDQALALFHPTVLTTCAHGWPNCPANQTA
jgi:hypothetical protein